MAYLARWPADASAPWISAASDERDEGMKWRRAVDVVLRNVPRRLKKCRARLFAGLEKIDEGFRPAICSGGDAASFP
jgi:hypothetical protein